MFSNGDLDPWSGLGVTGWINYKVPYVMIKGGAHHIDLREPNDADPADAVWARQQHEDLITQWVADYQDMGDMKKFISFF